MVAISSTTIITKAFTELRVVGRVREIVFGILIVVSVISASGDPLQGFRASPPDFPSATRHTPRVLDGGLPADDSWQPQSRY
jgi:hypothetical protein